MAAAMMTTTIQKTIEHESREANLQAAKQAVRTNRKKYLQRHTDLGADVIDVVRGTDIIKRHICRTNSHTLLFEGCDRSTWRNWLYISNKDFH